MWSLEVILGAAVRPEIGGQGLRSAGLRSFLPRWHSTIIFVSILRLFSVRFSILSALPLFLLVSNYCPDDNGSNGQYPNNRQNGDDGRGCQFESDSVSQTLFPSLIELKTLFTHCFPSGHRTMARKAWNE
jgi:hypothetical protein